MTEDANPVVVTVAPNGARRTQKDHPALPISPEEIAGCAASCREAGASVIHLHVRDDQGGHSLDLDLYRAAIEAIRNRVEEDLIIQVTTEAVQKYTPFEQMQMVQELKPEAVSLALREFMGADDPVSDFIDFTKWLDMAGVASQLIFYDLADIELFIKLKAAGGFPKNLEWGLFVLGRYSKNQQSRPKDLSPFLGDELRDDIPSNWGVCAFGERERDCLLEAVKKGGHPRVGFENNLWRPDGSLLEDNAEAVRKLVAQIENGPRNIATVEQTRKLMGIK